MKGQDIIDKLNQRSTNPSVRFEEILRKIFPQIAKDEGKLIQFEAKYKELVFDFVLPQGIKDYKKSVWVDIKYFHEKKLPLIFKSIENQFSPFKQILFYNGTGHISLNYILYILPFNLTVKEKQQILDYFKTFVNRFEIIIWDINDLEPYFQKYAEYIINGSEAI